MERRWGLIVEETTGTGERKTYSAKVLEHVTGTREQAMARLEECARSYGTEHPMNSISTRLYRTAEGFLLVKEGSMRGYGCRFSLAEVLYDSVAEEQRIAAAREERRQAEAQRKAAEKAAKRARRRSRWGL